MSSATAAKRELRRAARAAGESRVLELLARTGFGASAVLQVLLGALAIQLGADHLGEADQTGALKQLADIPGGFAVLWISVVGLLSLALWLVIDAFLVVRASRTRKWAERAVNLGKAAAYAALGFSALAFATGHPTHASDSTRTFSGSVLRLPGGPVLLALVGLATVAVGAFCALKGVRRTFTDDLDMPTGRGRHAVLALGIVGYVAKGVVVAVVGVLFITAAITARLDSATGLDGALQTLLRLPAGSILLFLLGAGFIGSGAYNAARAWLARF